MEKGFFFSLHFCFKQRFVFCFLFFFLPKRTLECLIQMSVRRCLFKRRGRSLQRQRSVTGRRVRFLIKCEGGKKGKERKDERRGDDCSCRSISETGSRIVFANGDRKRGIKHAAVVTIASLRIRRHVVVYFSVILS